MQEDQTNKVFEEIDESLRKAYDELLNQELPQRFVDLVQRLKEAERGTDGADGEGETP